jgi:hypothetical protein
LRHEALMRNCERRAPKVVWNASAVLSMRMKMIDVIGVKRLGGHVLEIAFSDDTVGARDFAEIKARAGEMVAPLRMPTISLASSSKTARSPGQTVTTGTRSRCTTR